MSTCCHLCIRDSLGGNCKTIMVATINPEASHTEESLSTCRFAQRVAMIKNAASINEDVDPDVIIRKLKNEILTLREEVAYLKVCCFLVLFDLFLCHTSHQGEAGEGDALTPKDLEDLRQRCIAYCDDADPQASLNIG